VNATRISSVGVRALVAVVALALGVAACQQQSTGDATREPAQSGSNDAPRVTIQQVEQWMDAGKPIFFLDSRSVAAWDAGTKKVPGALRVPPNDVEPYLDSIAKDRTIVAYCT
jgi:nitrous oxide reductase accessory protein NosL